MESFPPDWGEIRSQLVQGEQEVMCCLVAELHGEPWHLRDITGEAGVKASSRAWPLESHGSTYGPLEGTVVDQ